MPRRKFPGGIAPPSHLARVLANLNREPKPVLPTLSSLRLTLAKKNDHFGARHFVKEDLPRIRFLNPALKIEIVRKLQTEKEDFSPTMEVELETGKSQKINVDGMWSTNIFEDLMDLAGGPTWAEWKRTHPSERRPVETVLRGAARPRRAPAPKHKAQPKSIAAHTGTVQSPAESMELASRDEEGLEVFETAEDLEPEPVMKKARPKKAELAPIPEPEAVDTSNWKSVSTALP